MFSTTSDCMSVQPESRISWCSCQWDDLSHHYWHWAGRTPRNSVFLEGIYVALPQWIHFFGGKIYGPYLINPCAYDGHQFVRLWDEGFLSASVMLWIMSYASIESCLTMCGPVDGCTQDLQHYTGDSSLTFKDLLVKFLKGTNIPCPQLFSQAQVHFENIDVDLVDHNFYRPRVFCCTTTGSYDLECGDLSLSVCVKT